MNEALSIIRAALDVPAGDHDYGDDGEPCPYLEALITAEQALLEAGAT
jgi:hypothetical protein